MTLRGIVLTASLVLSLNAAHANEDTSPVGIFDIQKWIQLRDRAAASPQVTGLKLTIEIIYDRITGRPWPEADYWQEANKRWSAFQQAYCPSQISLCKLPATVATLQNLEAIRNGLVDPANRELINQRLLEVGLRLSPNLIFPVQMPVAESEKSNFSFRIATVEEETESNVEDTKLVIMGDVIMNDILTYRENYNHEMARTYFAVDSQGNGYVQADRVREAAYSMGARWKKAAERDVPHSTIDAEDLLLQAAKKDMNREFEATYARLLAKMDDTNPDHKEHIKRFQVERARGRYPTEVYQWISYDELLQIAKVLTEHYQQAKVSYGDLHTAATSLRGLATLQQQTNPRLLYALLQRDWDLDEAGVIEQITAKPLTGTYMLEHLQVLLEQPPYENSGGFEKYSGGLDYTFITEDQEFLKTHHPEFLQKMTELGLLDAEKLRSVPREIQMQWLKAFLTKDGKPFVMGIYRVSAMLSLSLNARQARDLAETIRKARLSNVGLQL